MRRERAGGRPCVVPNLDGVDSSAFFAAPSNKGDILLVLERIKADLGCFGGGSVTLRDQRDAGVPNGHSKAVLSELGPANCSPIKKEES